MITGPPELIPVIKLAEIPHQELDMQKATPIKEMTPKFLLKSWVYPISASLSASESPASDPFSLETGFTLGFFSRSRSLMVKVNNPGQRFDKSCKGMVLGQHSVSFRGGSGGCVGVAAGDSTKGNRPIQVNQDCCRIGYSSRSDRNRYAVSGCRCWQKLRWHTRAQRGIAVG